MENLSSAVDSISAPESIAQARAIASGGCPAMRIAWLTEEPAADRERCAGIRILIPGEQSAFHIVYTSGDGREHRAFVRGPHVAVIPAGDAHTLEFEPHADILVVTLDQAYFELKAREALGAQAPQLKGYHIGYHIAIDPFLRELGNTLRSELQMMKIPTQGYLDCVAAIVAIHLVRQHGAQPISMQGYSGLAPHKLKRVQTFIAEHFAEALRLEQLAQIIHMSPFHFARMFKKATGRPPHVYITAQRMEHAKTLLKDSELPLVEVAACVGFQTQGHFTGVFRRYSGVTPRIFRLHCQAARSQGEGEMQSAWEHDGTDGVAYAPRADGGPANFLCAGAKGGKKPRSLSLCVSTAGRSC